MPPTQIRFKIKSRKIKITSPNHVQICFQFFRKQNFQESLIPLSHWGHNVKSTSHLLLYYPKFTAGRHIFLTIVNDANKSFLKYTDLTLTNLFVFGNMPIDWSSKIQIVNAIVGYMFSMMRFEEPHF